MGLVATVSRTNLGATGIEIIVFEEFVQQLQQKCGNVYEVNLCLNLGKQTECKEIIVSTKNFIIP